MFKPYLFSSWENTPFPSDLTTNAMNSTFSQTNSFEVELQGYSTLPEGM